MKKKMFFYFDYFGLGRELIVDVLEFSCRVVFNGVGSGVLKEILSDT